MGFWRRTMASGSIVLIPVLVCGLPLVWIYWQLRQLPLFLGVHPPIVRVFVVLAFFGTGIMSVGYLMRTTLGHVVDDEIDALIDRFPGVGLIHTSAKGLVQTVILRRNGSRLPIKIEVSEDVYLTALRTGNWTADGREVVFVPGAPDVTSGFVVEMHPTDVIETDETFIEVVVRLVTGGFGEARDPRTPPTIFQGSNESVREGNVSIQRTV